MPIPAPPSTPALPAPPAPVVQTPPRVGPPTKHQLALMIWVAVFPTLTVLNVALGSWLVSMPSVLRTLVLATLAVPIVIYGLMPQLHKVRVRLITGSSTG